VTTAAKRDQVAAELRKLVLELARRRAEIDPKATLPYRRALHVVYGEASHLVASCEFLVAMLEADEG
jgi:hypothetical protein